MIFSCAANQLDTLYCVDPSYNITTYDDLEQFVIDLNNQQRAPLVVTLTSAGMYIVQDTLARVPHLLAGRYSAMLSELVPVFYNAHGTYKKVTTQAAISMQCPSQIRHRLIPGPEGTSFTACDSGHPCYSQAGYITFLKQLACEAIEGAKTFRDTLRGGHAYLTTQSTVRGGASADHERKSHALDARRVLTGKGSAKDKKWLESYETIIKFIKTSRQSSPTLQITGHYRRICTQYLTQKNTELRSAQFLLLKEIPWNKQVEAIHMGVGWNWQRRLQAIEDRLKSGTTQETDMSCDNQAEKSLRLTEKKLKDNTCSPSLIEHALSTMESKGTSAADVKKHLETIKTLLQQKHVLPKDAEQDSVAMTEFEPFDIEMMDLVIAALRNTHRNPQNKKSALPDSKLPDSKKDTAEWITSHQYYGSYNEKVKIMMLATSDDVYDLLQLTQAGFYRKIATTPASVYRAAAGSYWESEASLWTTHMSDLYESCTPESLINALNFEEFKNHIPVIKHEIVSRIFGQDYKTQLKKLAIAKPTPKPGIINSLYNKLFKTQQVSVLTADRRLALPEVTRVTRDKSTGGMLIHRTQELQSVPLQPAPAFIKAIKRGNETHLIRCALNNPPSEFNHDVNTAVGDMY